MTQTRGRASSSARQISVSPSPLPHAATATMGAAESKEVFSVPAYRCKATGQSPVIRHKEFASELVTGINGVDTLYSNFQRGVSLAGDRPCLGTRKALADGTKGEYEWQTYNQISTRLTNLGSGLVGLGLTKGDFVGLFSMNRAEWVIAEQACAAYGLVSVPLYDTLGPNAATYILNQTEMTAIVVSGDKLPTLLEAAQECPHLRYAIVMDDDSSAPAATTGVEVIAFKALEGRGAASPVKHSPASREDLATICYTSGTTGDPKGAMLSNGNFAAALAGINLGDVALNLEDKHLSYLPLAHMFERIVQAALFHNGGSIGFYQGDVTKLLEDLAVLRPTVFPSVPRLFNRIYDKLVQGVAVAGGAKKMLFEYALSSKSYYLKDGHTTHALWDKLVFSKLRALLGGNVRVMITGSAPISSAVKDFLQVVFCCPVFEGYGLTETCAMGTVTPDRARDAGHVGVPACCCEVRLDDIPEMDYLSTDKPLPRGEICFRGPNIFKGYYKNTAKTDECMSDGGWFHTGDVGRLNANGTISIIDRKKNIFKLAQGEYIAPEKIENIYCRSPYVAQCFIYGDSFKSQLVCVVVPDPEVVETWAAEHKVSGDAMASDALKKTIHADMKRVATEAKLHSFEKAKSFVVDPEPFAVENGLLTPTFKLIRNKLRAHYQTRIDTMYDELAAGHKKA